jgi:hypothetical protein
MNSHIDFRTLPNNVPSLCIPRVFSNWTETRIRRIFDDLNMGEIQRIDVISKTTEKGEKFNRVFVHFKHWFANETADMARERLLNGKEIKIMYDEPWFWKVSAYREPIKKPDHNPDRNQRPRASIHFDDDREQELSKGRPRCDDRRPRHVDIKPIAKKSREQFDDRRPRPVDRRPAPRESKPIAKNSREQLDLEVEKISSTIPENTKVCKPDPVVHTPVHAVTDFNPNVKLDYGDCPVPPKRRIMLKKEHVVVKQSDLKIELEEGELSDEVASANV